MVPTLMENGDFAVLIVTHQYQQVDAYVSIIYADSGCVSVQEWVTVSTQLLVDVQVTILRSVMAPAPSATAIPPSPTSSAPPTPSLSSYTW